MAEMVESPHIIIDRSAENVPNTGFTVVESEIEFVRLDGKGALWVRGDLCDYVRAVYMARGIGVLELDSPRVRLKTFIGEAADKISESLVKRLVDIVDESAPNNLSELLALLTGDDFWTTKPSTIHAAKYLLLEIAVDLHELIETQRLLWLKFNDDPKLDEIYKCPISERNQVLKNWLLEPALRQTLGEFPLQLPVMFAELLGSEIGKKLRSTEGAFVDDFPQRTPNKNIYAAAAMEYFSHHPSQLTHNRIAQLSALLTRGDRKYLEDLLRHDDIDLLTLDSDFHSVLHWATEQYLPFRALQEKTNETTESDRLADSFAGWMLENYPKLTHIDREISPLNLRTFYKVKELSKEYWVLWVVVDGLSYLNHQKLLQLVTDKSAQLRVSENSALLSVLPTITEKAKYGLTAGRFPQENSSNDWTIQNSFLSLFPRGVYAGNNGMAALAAGLKSETPRVCYWNYTKIDKCFHDHTDLSYLDNEIDGHLSALAKNINQIVSSAFNINRVAVVICSDHGQITKQCKKISVNHGDNVRVHGRTILHGLESTPPKVDAPFLETNEGLTVYLDPTSFRLSEPTTVALGSSYFVDLKAAGSDGAIGVHGGLYPEEVVVGMAVLTRQAEHKPLSVMLTGSGEAGRSGTVQIEIDNPNPVTVTPLFVQINGINIVDQTELTLAKVRPYQLLKLDLPIANYPEPTAGDEFPLNGTLTYEFDDGQKEHCEVSGTLKCTSLYTTKNPSLLSRFKK